MRIRRSASRAARPQLTVRWLLSEHEWVSATYSLLPSAERRGAGPTRPLPSSRQRRLQARDAGPRRTACATPPTPQSRCSAATACFARWKTGPASTSTGAGWRTGPGGFRPARMRWRAGTSATPSRAASSCRGRCCAACRHRPRCSPAACNGPAVPAVLVVSRFRLAVEELKQLEPGGAVVLPESLVAAMARLAARGRRAGASRLRSAGRSRRSLRRLACCPPPRTRPKRRKPTCASPAKCGSAWCMRLPPTASAAGARAKRSTRSARRRRCGARAGARPAAPGHRPADALGRRLGAGPRIAGRLAEPDATLTH